MGPDRRSVRRVCFFLAGAGLSDVLFAVGVAFPRGDFFEAVFFVDVFFVVAFFFEVFPAEAFFRGAAFFLAADFFDAFLPPAFFAAVFFRFAGDFFAVTFFREVFLPAFFADFFADFFAAGFRAVVRLRATDFFFDAFLVEDLLLITLRLVPVDFLRTAVLRAAVFFLLAPARLRFLLAAFLAGMFDSCRSGKNAELYIA